MPTVAAAATPMPTVAAAATPMPTVAAAATPMPTVATETTPMPTLAPVTPFPTTGTTAADVQNLIVGTVSNADAVSNAATPQGRALATTVAALGDAGVDVNAQRQQILQRYAADVFYFATSLRGWADDTGWRGASDPCSTTEPWFGVGCAGNDITSIQLVRNNLSGALPSELSVLTALREYTESYQYQSLRVCCIFLSSQLLIQHLFLSPCPSCPLCSSYRGVGSIEQWLSDGCYPLGVWHAGKPRHAQCQPQFHGLFVPSWTTTVPCRQLYPHRIGPIDITG